MFVRSYPCSVFDRPLFASSFPLGLSFGGLVSVRLRPHASWRMGRRFFLELLSPLRLRVYSISPVDVVLLLVWLVCAPFPYGGVLGTLILAAAGSARLGSL